MCYSVSVKLNKLQGEIESEFNQKFSGSLPDFYHISGYMFPRLAVLTANSFQTMNWGLIPQWCKNLTHAHEMRNDTLNARSETLSEKPSFSTPFKQNQNCIIPLSGFFESRHEGKDKKPYFIYPDEYPVFLMAGIFDTWIDPKDGTHDQSFSIITTQANDTMSFIHNSKQRMPALLELSNARKWLDPEVDFTEKQALLIPFPDNGMKYHRVAPFVNHAKKDRNIPQAIDPFDEPQLSLF